MRFLPTLNLNDSGIYEALSSGQLRLQTGQWVIVNPGCKPSRWVGRSKGGSLWLVHPSGAMRDLDCSVSTLDFRVKAALFRGDRELARELMGGAA